MTLPNLETASNTPLPPFPKELGLNEVIQAADGRLRKIGEELVEVNAGLPKVHDFHEVRSSIPEMTERLKSLGIVKNLAKKLYDVNSESDWIAAFGDIKKHFEKDGDFSALRLPPEIEKFTPAHKQSLSSFLERKLAAQTTETNKRYFLVDDSWKKVIAGKIESVDEALKTALTDSEKAATPLIDGLKKIKDVHVRTDLAKGEAVLNEYNILVGWAKKLIGTPAEQEAAFKEIIGKFPDGFKDHQVVNEANIARAKSRIATTLDITKREIVDFYKDHKNRWEGTVAQAAGRTAEEASGFGFGAVGRAVKKAFDWHQSKISHLEPETRMMFGWGEAMVGTALMGASSRGFLQVWNGQKEKAVQKIDDKGKLYIDFEIQRMSKQAQILEGALRIGGMGAGAALTGAGIYNLFKPF